MVPALKKKMAHIFALIFSAEYPEHWTTFFEDIFFTNLHFENIAQFFLLTLLEVNVEIASRDKFRTNEVLVIFILFCVFIKGSACFVL